MPQNFKTRSFGLMLFALVMTCSQSHGQDGLRAGYSGVPDNAFSVVAEIRAKPGRESELRAATLPLVAQVRRDPNNLLYFLHEDRDAPGHFIFYEIFPSKTDFEAHNATPYVQAWFAKLPELADGGVKAIHTAILDQPRR